MSSLLLLSGWPVDSSGRLDRGYVISVVAEKVHHQRIEPRDDDGNVN